MQRLYFPQNFKVAGEYSMIELINLDLATAFYFDKGYVYTLTGNVTKRYTPNFNECKAIYYGGYCYPLFNGERLIFKNQSFQIKNA